MVVDYLADDNRIGAAIINKTGMKGYIPENILVYIATHKDQRGKGIGKQIMKTIIENTDGDIALHVEHENPALHLYKKLGFTNKYLEMRLTKKGQH
jgi:ribosomal protein S18 acetylase RimI-like enzyme